MLLTHKYISVDDTVKKIFNLIYAWYADPRLKTFDNKNLQYIFNYVSKRIPYVADPENVATQGNDTVELLKAPHITDLNGGDCDDKSIYLGAIFERKKIPYRLKVVSTNSANDYHHIYPEIFIAGNWMPFDATYNTGILGIEKPYAKAKVFYYEKNTGTVTSQTLGPSVSMLNGNHAAMAGTRLITLTGNNKNGVRLNDFMLDDEIKFLNYQAQRKMLLGKLGFDPVTVATAAAAIIGAIFGGGGPIPPDNRTMLQLLNSKIDQVYSTYGNIFGSDQAMDEITGYRAMKAAGLAKWGLIPSGKAIHDIWPSIPWSEVENEMTQSAAAFYPFLRWIAEQDRQKGQYKGYDNDAMLVQYFNAAKTGSGPVYAAFVQAGGIIKPKGLSTAGFGSLPMLLLIGAGVYLIMNKKKGR